MTQDVRPFKGWTVLSGGFINATLLAGAILYAYGLFVTPMQETFELTREQANYGLLILYVSMMVWAVLIGRWLERLSAKTLSMLGGAAFALGYISIAIVPSPILLLLSIALFLGFSITASGPFLANVLAARWFDRRRGRALGIAAIASSMGGFLIVPVLAKGMEIWGWKAATIGAALLIGAAISIVSALMIISQPEDVGQTPDGDPVTSDSSDQTLDIPKINLFKTRDFWLIALGVGLLLSCDQALLASIIPYGEDRGFSRTEAAMIMTTITGSAVLGKFLVGWLAERWDLRALFALVCLSNIAFLLTLLLSPSYPVLLLIGGIVGMAIGGVYPVWTTLTAAAFGRGLFSRAMGLMNLITVPMIMIAVTIAGRSFDQTGSYDLALKIFIPQVILAAALIFMIRRKAA